MTTRTWNGDIADWNTDADWGPATPGNDVPDPGDTAVIASGTVILTSDAAAADQLFETNEVTLGGGDGATLLLRNQYLTGRYFRSPIRGRPRSRPMAAVVSRAASPPSQAAGRP